MVPAAAGRAMSMPEENSTNYFNKYNGLLETHRL
jgi:hypothetical protein